MTVLLVDDQISILSGLISGLDWNTLGVTSIRSASNADQAKEILENEPVDVLLCDIEMPGENGLALLRWARNQGMDFVCVFLTSHADFLYAKEAIQLNCFDYILQPARYDEIQATIAKAIARVKASLTEKKLEQYGTVAKSQTTGLFQNLFSDWVAGKSLSISTLQAVLRQLGEDLPEDGDCFILWGHLLRWRTESWPMHDWVYALNNIMLEVYQGARCRILPFSIDYTSVGWFVYAPTGHFPKPEDVLEPLNEAYLAITRHLPCDFAFYAGPVIPLDQVDTQYSLLLNAKQNNVLHESGIFHPVRRSNKLHMEKFLDIVQLRRWESLLTEGQGYVASEEACSFLDNMAQKGELNQNVLRGFWIQFQQAALNAARTQNRNLHEIMAVLEQGSKAQSLQDVQASIQAASEYFPSDETYGESEKRLTEQIKKYVEDNLCKSLSVNNIAASLFMSPDYISRLFKNEMGSSLKEYIISKKMESARILLKTTALPINVIASKVGYDNYSYFSQVYRKAMGLSPKDERKEKQAASQADREGAAN